MKRLSSHPSLRSLPSFTALVSLATLAIVFLAPRLARACAVCSAGRDDESNTAFLISTIFLSVLPLAGLGTLVFVLWRRIQRLEAEKPAPLDERQPAPNALA